MSDPRSPGKRPRDEDEQDALPKPKRPNSASPSDPDLAMVQVPKSFFTCQFCMEIAIEPMWCSNFHLSCSVCTGKWENKECPSCRVKGVTPAKPIHALLETSDIKLPCGLSLDCQLVQSYSRVVDHRKNHCLHDTRPCLWCSENIPRGQLNKHSTERCLKGFLFHSCGAVVLRSNLSEHVKTCLAIKNVCVNLHRGCLALVSRQDSHEKVCPFAMIPCPLAKELQSLKEEMRCPTPMLLRKDLAAHMEDTLSHALYGIIKGKPTTEEPMEQEEQDKVESESVWFPTSGIPFGECVETSVSCCDTHVYYYRQHSKNRGRILSVPYTKNSSEESERDHAALITFLYSLLEDFDKVGDKLPEIRREIKENATIRGVYISQLFVVLVFAQGFAIGRRNGVMEPYFSFITYAGAMCFVNLILNRFLVFSTSQNEDRSLICCDLQEQKEMGRAHSLGMSNNYVHYRHTTLLNCRETANRGMEVGFSFSPVPGCTTSTPSPDKLELPSEFKHHRPMFIRELDRLFFVADQTIYSVDCKSKQVSSIRMDTRTTHWKLQGYVQRHLVLTNAIPMKLMLVSVDKFR